MNFKAKQRARRYRRYRKTAYNWVFHFKDAWKLRKRRKAIYAWIREGEKRIALIKLVEVQRIMSQIFMESDWNDENYQYPTMHDIIGYVPHKEYKEYQDLNKLYNRTIESVKELAHKHTAYLYNRRSEVPIAIAKERFFDALDELRAYVIQEKKDV